MTSRRQFIAKLSKASLLSVLPLPTQYLFADAPANQDTIIDAVEILKISGSHKVSPGLHKQYQAKPIHIYPDLHPAPYKDNSSIVDTTEKLTQNYLRIKTK